MKVIYQVFASKISKISNILSPANTGLLPVKTGLVLE